MRLWIVGSGGALAIPRPGCPCRVCADARQHGGRAWRAGPCVYVPEAALLIDTPEDVCPAVERAGITDIDHIFFSHWHPDHCAGRRIVEQLSYDLAVGGARHCTDVWLDLATEARYAADWQYYIQREFCRMHVVADGASVDLGVLRARWFRYAPDDMLSGFVLEDHRVSVLVLMDETKDLAPRIAGDPTLQGCDFLLAECGWFERDFANNVLVREDSPLRATEASFEADTLPLLRAARAQRVVLHHLMDLQGRTPAEFDTLAAVLDVPGVQFAYDGLQIEV